MTSDKRTFFQWLFGLQPKPEPEPQVEYVNPGLRPSTALIGDLLAVFAAEGNPTYIPNTKAWELLAKRDRRWADRRRAVGIKSQYVSTGIPAAFLLEDIRELARKHNVTMPTATNAGSLAGAAPVQAVFTARPVKKQKRRQWRTGEQARFLAMKDVIAAAIESGQAPYSLAKKYKFAESNFYRLINKHIRNKQVVKPKSDAPKGLTVHGKKRVRAYNGQIKWGHKIPPGMQIGNTVTFPFGDLDNTARKKKAAAIDFLMKFTAKNRGWQLSASKTPEAITIKRDA